MLTLGAPPSERLSVFSYPEILQILSFWVPWRLHCLGMIAKRLNGGVPEGLSVEILLGLSVQRSFLQGMG
jgi:hypothetical protein